jgi:phytoene dehydrogenase-like protein
MVEAIENRGGSVFVRCPVAEVLLDDNGAAIGVRLANGDEIRARRVVSAIGYRATEALLAASTPPPPTASQPLATQQSAGAVRVFRQKFTLEECH